MTTLKSSFYIRDQDESIVEAFLRPGLLDPTFRLLQNNLYGDISTGTLSFGGLRQNSMGMTIGGIESMIDFDVRVVYAFGDWAGSVLLG